MEKVDTVIASDLTQLIGGTPLVELARLAREFGLQARLLAKAECFNAAGSVKDRVARELIEDAERSGRLRPGGTVVEPTSGNTGVGLALVCALKGYRLILTMPESMSVERRKLLRALGAQLVLTPASEGMGGAIAKAEQILAGTEGAVLAGQFVNRQSGGTPQDDRARDMDADGRRGRHLCRRRRHGRHHYRRGQLPERAEAGCEK